MTQNPDDLLIVHHPATVLRQRARPIEDITDEIRAIAERMIELMHEAPGVGLAAPQVGISARLFVANPSGHPDDDHVYINPRFVELSQDQEVAEEGCLSLPDITCEVQRPAAATIKAIDLEGNEFQETADGLLARIWQHESDHLDGVLILDKMSASDRAANREALKALEQS